MYSRCFAVMFTVLLLIGCGRKGTEPASITDDQITAFIAWNERWIDLARKHYDEANAVSRRAADRYSPDVSKVSTDPELLSTLARQRGEMQDHMNRRPLNDAQMQAIKRVYEGIIPQRDDQKLSQARARYGDRFVDRVLAHETEIRAALKPRLQ
jgi:hypothetical protein